MSQNVLVRYLAVLGHCMDKMSRYNLLSSYEYLPYLIQAELHQCHQ